VCSLIGRLLPHVDEVEACVLKAVGNISSGVYGGRRWITALIGFSEF
jgi:hypothetical protein